MLPQLIAHYEDAAFLKADGFDEAIIGVDEQTMRLIYSVSKVLAILGQDMSEDEAQEYFDFNIARAYMGEQTPIWCQDVDLL
jgi:hypothetical protein